MNQLKHYRSIGNYFNYLHKQTAANSLTALSGGGQSGKNGLTTYFANVSAIIACNKKLPTLEFYMQTKNK